MAILGGTATHIYNHIAFLVFRTSRPIPIAAAIGSYIIYTSYPPACSEESRNGTYFSTSGASLMEYKTTI